MHRPLLAFALLAACADADLAPSVDGSTTSLIYGRDDRMEFYQAPAVAQDIADSVVALMDRSWLTQRFDGSYDVDTSYELRDDLPVCQSEPYRTQPVPAECSGVLVGPDTIATAGHCMSGNACSRLRFVFGFRLDGANNVRSHVDADDVYRCSRVIASSTGSADYALVQLDRAVNGHDWLEVRSSGKVANNASLVLMGHPYGMPLKIAAGATVRQNSASAWFGANLDSYSGNSGSPVINTSTLDVEGILVRGNNDFVYRNGCYTSNVCPNTGCPGFEESTRATEFASRIP